ncbi:MAG TPA: hypothetical protein VFM05_15210, partial [Candidatus Saccharimonadales bacterium]|nr:hypothetical protein [Candidatus Saccharimonadales bacterium]
VGYNKHMIFEMLRWWYTTGWLQTLERVTTWPQSVERAFSIILLLRTLFAPWKRIVSMPGKSLDAKLRATLDNLVSRLIGSVVRFGVLIVAGISTFAAFAAAALLAVVWPLMPIGIIFFMIKGIVG